MTIPSGSRARGSSIALLVLFFLSGTSGLVYQVIWVRQFGRIFGNTIHSASLVTAVFMCGLGVGSYLAGPWIDRRYARSRTLPLRAYGALELGIAALGAVLAVTLPRLTYLAALSSYSRGAGGWFELSMSAYALRCAVAIVLLAPSTLLMGATLTLLIRHVVASDVSDAGFRVGLLYGVNTAGAALGALLTDFALVPKLGLWNTQIAAVSMSGLAGLGALALARREPPIIAPAEPETGEPRRDEPLVGGRDPSAKIGSVVSEGAADPTGRRVVAFTAAALALSGFSAMGMEIVWFRFLTEVLGSLRAVLSLLLAVILAGIWLGAIAGGLVHRRVKRPLLLLLVAQGLFVFITLLTLGLFDHQSDLKAGIEAVRGAHALAPPLERALIDLGVDLRSIALVAFGPAFLMGLGFPLANAHVQRSESSVGVRAGALYLSNTLGNVLGALFTGFLLLPTLGIQRTTALLAACTIAGLLPLYFSTRPPRPEATERALAGGLALGIVGLAAFLSLPADRLLSPSVPRLGPGATRKVISVSEGLNETIAVTEIRGFERRLFTNGHSMSSTHPKSQRYMRAFAHLPLLSMERPERALVICFGVGITLHAASLHPSIASLELADLSRHVLEHAPFFSEANGDVLRDPRVSVFIDDGRHHLVLEPEGSYDLVTLEPPPIAFAGVASLYSREFYELVRSRLRVGGFATQWLPAYQMPAEVDLAMVRAFIDVFPASVLLSGDDNELILMGTTGASITLDVNDLSRRLDARPAVRADLDAIDLGTPIEIAGTFVASHATMVAATRATLPLTDDRPILEYAQRSGLRSTRMPPELFDVSGIDSFCPRCRASIAGLDGYLRVRGLLYASEAFLRSGSKGTGADFALPDDEETAAVVSRSRYLTRLLGGDVVAAREAAAQHLARGELPAAIGAFERALELGGDDPELREELGRASLLAGNPRAAASMLGRAVEAAPQRATSRFGLGAALRELGDLDDALVQYRAGLALAPRDVDAHLDCAAILRQTGRAEDAEVEFKAALEVDAMHPRVNLLLCRRAAARKDFAEATKRCDVAKAGGARLPPDLEALLGPPGPPPSTP